MKPSLLVLRSLTYYWRTNAAVVLGVATAVAVLAGALLVGDSVRGSLRDLVLERLGRTDHVVVSAGFFRERLAEDLRSHPSFEALFDGMCPMVAAQGLVTDQASNRLAGRVLVYGVDDRFWQFHRVPGVRGPADREALISEALAEELGAQPGEAILIRMQRPSAVPLESIHGRKEDLGRTLRATVRAVLPREALGEFSLQPQQGSVRAVFLPLAWLQEELDVRGRVNTLLVSARPERGAIDASALERLVRSEWEFEDLGLRLRVLAARQAIVLESDGGLLTDAQAAAARDRDVLAGLGLGARPVFTYLANSLRSGAREIPYSLVTAIDLTSIVPAGALPPAADGSPIVLNAWAAEDLQVSSGDPVVLEYYLWEEPGRLLTRTAEFRVASVVPNDAGDRDLAPAYPGITESPTLGDWDPPFPIDLRRIRRVDEEYWKLYRTTPKAFIPLAVGQQLWASRYGAMTSVRLLPEGGEPLEDKHRDYSERLRVRLDPLAMGLVVSEVRAAGLEASRGATDFGEYFVYFSFFLVVSALLLAALFFKLSVEQRAREIGLLRAVGFRPVALRRLFFAEGLLLSGAGSVVGVLGGVGYAYLMITGLRTWWIGAVGTDALTLHVSPASLVVGAVGGIAVAMACIWATLRHLASSSERSLLAGQLADSSWAASGLRSGGLFLMVATGLIVLGAALLAATVAGLVETAGAFFGAGATLLGACVFLFVFWFRRSARDSGLSGRGWRAVSRLGLRSAMYRPWRSVVAITVIASATFILIAVDAFRREEEIVSTDAHSGVGGYSVLVETLLPVAHDPNSREGREVLGLAAYGDSVAIEPFRVLPGDDASCLNLYEPKSPRILAPTDRFIAGGRFAFQASLATSEAERRNPWLLLERDLPDGVVPVIADANSMTYVLHRKLGEEIILPGGDRPIRLRLVAALADSIFQGELLMSQTHFLRLFPEREGYQVLLVGTTPERGEAVGRAIEEALVDFGADATPTGARLAEYHKVENTYLSTFQTLGGLGLLLGTVGLGAVLLRNVLERRRELALLRALGYKPGHFFTMVMAENALLLVSGLVTGTVCALVAIAPVVLDRGGRLPAGSLGLLLGGVLVAGLVASLGATAAALRSPLLSALRAE